MTKINNVTIEFSCLESLDDKLFCGKCSRQVVDFTSKTEKALGEESKKSSQSVCGIFKKSQLSDQFLKYAAATFIATSLTIPAFGQRATERDSLSNSCEKGVTDDTEDVFFGVIVETQAEPVGGYKKFYETLASKIKYPHGLTVKGKSFVQFTIDTLGQMNDVKLIKGFNELADREAVRVVSTLHYPFKPGRQRGKLVMTRLVLPIPFDPADRGKR